MAPEPSNGRGSYCRCGCGFDSFPFVKELDRSRFDFATVLVWVAGATGNRVVSAELLRWIVVSGGWVISASGSDFTGCGGGETRVCGSLPRSRTAILTKEGPAACGFTFRLSLPQSPTEGEIGITGAMHPIFASPPVTIPEVDNVSLYSESNGAHSLPVSEFPASDWLLQSPGVLPRSSNRSIMLSNLSITANRLFNSVMSSLVTRSAFKSEILASRAESTAL